ncbi:MAG TPA: energy transducer TonB [Gemmatimonadaceae bacterium]|nr:energy transducer TonB [Gemmatimonadaceae bacterium]
MEHHPGRRGSPGGFVRRHHRRGGRRAGRARHGRLARADVGRLLARERRQWTRRRRSWSWTREGDPELPTLSIVSSDHPALVPAVRRAVAESRFTPATRGGRPVRQLVQQPYDFVAEPPPGR